MKKPVINFSSVPTIAPATAKAIVQDRPLTAAQEREAETQIAAACRELQSLHLARMRSRTGQIRGK